MQPLLYFDWFFTFYIYMLNIRDPLSAFSLCSFDSLVAASSSTLTMSDWGESDSEASPSYGRGRRFSLFYGWKDPPTEETQIDSDNDDNGSGSLRAATIGCALGPPPQGIRPPANCAANLPRRRSALLFGEDLRDYHFHKEQRRTAGHAVSNDGSNDEAEEAEDCSRSPPLQ